MSIELDLGGMTLRLDDAQLDQLAAALAPRIAAAAPAASTGWLDAKAAADYIGAPLSRVYALAECNPPRIPVHRDGKRLRFKPADLDEWVCSGGGKRP